MLADLSECPPPHTVAVSLRVGSAVALTRVAACNDIAGAVEVEASHVVVDRDAGPVLSEDGLAELVLLTERDGSKRSSSFKSKAKPSYS